MESEREIEQSNGMQQVERERKSSLVDAPQLDLTLAHRKRTKLAADHLSLSFADQIAILNYFFHQTTLTYSLRPTNTDNSKKKKVGKEMKVLKNRKLKAKKLALSSKR